MILQPCQNIYKLPHTSSTIDLINNTSEGCEVTTKDETVHHLRPNQTLTLPLVDKPSNGNSQDLSFLVKRGGRKFTVRAKLLEAENRAEKYPDENKKIDDNRLNDNSSKLKSKENQNLGDSLTLSTENLINDRLQEKRILSEKDSKDLTPHARLAAVRRKLSRDKKALMIKKEGAEILLKIDEALRNQTLYFNADFKDQGLKEGLWEILNRYNPVWLNFALRCLIADGPDAETSSGEKIHTAILKQQIMDQILSSSQIIEQQKDTRQGALPENFDFVLRMTRHVICRLLEVVFFLDRARTLETLHDPLLFRKDPKKSSGIGGEIKSSEDVIRAFAEKLIAGDLVKQLKKFGYEVSHKQEPIDEYETKISGDLHSKLRDGVILGLFVKSFHPEIDVLKNFRIPSTERLHSLKNNEKLLDVIKRIDESLLETGKGGKITRDDLVDMKNPEKVLTFVWKLVLGFSLNSIVDEDLILKEIRQVCFRNHKNAEWKRTMNELAAEEADSKDGGSGNNHLLPWVQVVSAIYPRVPKVKNFSTSISDGSALCMLVHHYHPEILPVEAIYFPEQQTSTDGEKLRNLGKERKNFSLLNEAVERLGDIPIRLNSYNSKNPITGKIGFAFIAFLCSRLLSDSKETKAANTIKSLFLAKHAKKHPQTLESAKKAKALILNRSETKLEELKAEEWSKGIFFRNLFSPTALINSDRKANRKKYFEQEFDEDAENKKSLVNKLNSEENGRNSILKSSSQIPNKEKKAHRANIVFEEENEGKDDIQREQAFKLQLQEEEEAYRLKEEQEQLKMQEQAQKARERELKEKHRLKLEMKAAEEEERRQQQVNRERLQQFKDQQTQELNQEKIVRREENEKLTEKARLVRQMEKQLQEEREAHLTIEKRFRDVSIRLEESKSRERALKERMEQAESAVNRERKKREEMENRILQEKLSREESDQEILEAKKRIQSLVQQRDEAIEKKESLERLNEINYDLNEVLANVELAKENLEKDLLAKEKQLSLQSAKFEKRIEEERKSFESQIMNEKEQNTLLSKEKSEFEEEIKFLRQEIFQLENQLQAALEQAERDQAMMAKEQARIAAVEEAVEEEKQQLKLIQLEQDREKAKIRQQQEKQLLELEKIRLANKQEKEFLEADLLQKEQSIVEKQEELKRIAIEQKRRLEEIEYFETSIKEAQLEEFNKLEMTRIKEETRLKAFEQDLLRERQRLEEQEKVLNDALQQREKVVKEVQIAKSTIVPHEISPVRRVQEEESFVEEKVEDEYVDVQDLIELLKNKSTYRKLGRLNKRKIAFLLGDRECLKRVIFALKSLQRSESEELCHLLNALQHSIRENPKLVSDLAVHFASALVDVLQTFYDRRKEFKLTLEIFTCLSKKYQDKLEFRLKTLLELFDTKIQIQKLCGKPVDAVTEKNLKSLNMCMSLS